MRTILLCLHEKDGQAWADQHGYTSRDLLLITPRSAARARGRNVDAIYATPALRATYHFEHLTRETEPCLISRPIADLVAPTR